MHPGDGMFLKSTAMTRNRSGSPEKSLNEKDKPTIIIGKTIMGKECSTMRIKALNGRPQPMECR
jgi:hypothetical protein